MSFCIKLYVRRVFFMDDCVALWLTGMRRSTARHVYGEPGKFVSVFSETHKGHCDGFWRRCVAHSSHPRSNEKLRSFSVQKCGTRMGSPWPTTSLLSGNLVRLLPRSRSTQRRLRTAISDASTVASTSREKAPVCQRLVPCGRWPRR